MFVALVRKHGLVPKSRDAGDRRVVLDAAAQPRPDGRAAAGGPRPAGPCRGRRVGRRPARPQGGDAARRSTGCCSLHLGTPPESVSWQWTDKDKGFHRDEHDHPAGVRRSGTSTSTWTTTSAWSTTRDPPVPVGHVFTVEHLGNVVSGTAGHLSQRRDVADQATALGSRSSAATPVWFGCDVGQMMEKEEGVWDARLFDYDGVYDIAHRVRQGRSARCTARPR